jgi:hypothetical protein
MNKQLQFSSLPDLILNFKECYLKNGHVLHKLKIGLPITHNLTSSEQIEWKFLVIPNISQKDWKDVAQEIRLCARSW